MIFLWSILIFWKYISMPDFLYDFLIWDESNHPIVTIPPSHPNVWITLLYLIFTLVAIVISVVYLNSWFFLLQEYLLTSRFANWGCSNSYFFLSSLLLPLIFSKLHCTFQLSKLMHLFILWILIKTHIYCILICFTFGPQFTYIFLCMFVFLHISNFHFTFLLSLLVLPNFSNLSIRIFILQDLIFLIKLLPEVFHPPSPIWNIYLSTGYRDVTLLHPFRDRDKTAIIIYWGIYLYLLGFMDSFCYNLSYNTSLWKMHWR